MIRKVNKDGTLTIDWEALAQEKKVVIEQYKNYLIKIIKNGGIR